MIPYGRHWISEEDVAAVIGVLRSEWLTTGPMVEAFEQAIADHTGAPHAVALASGTAGLHAAMYALEISPGDEVVVPAMTFAATANAVVFQGGTPVFVDVDPETLLIDPAGVESRLTDRTTAIVAVDYGGQPCDYESLAAIARPRGVAIVADACHALGARDRGRPVGSLADLTVFSFHPVKAITTGEGGMVTTANGEWAARMRRFRNHGMSADHRERQRAGSWAYEIVDLGYNYRLTDFQCALGLSQLQRLPAWIQCRQQLARRYDEAFRDLAEVAPLAVRAGVEHAYHLYVVRLALERLRRTRAEVFAALHEAGIGVNVHYLPVHLHPFYRRRFGTRPGQCPVAEAAYERILSLPLFPAMPADDLDTVVQAVRRAAGA